MAQMRYMFGDLATDKIIAELPISSVSMDKKLNDWGIFRGTLRYNRSGLSNADLTEATTPGKYYLIVERESTPIWEGIVWTRVYDSQGLDLNITARTYEGYMEHVFVKEDLTYTQQDPRNIMIDLFNRLQTDPNANIRVNVPTAFPNPGTLTDLEVKASEYKDYATLFSALADGQPGFDWTINTARLNNAYYRYLSIGTPLLGTPNVVGLGFDYPGNLTGYWKTDGMTDAGTHLYLIGAGEGDSMIVGTAVQQDLISSGFRRYDVTVSRKDVTSQAIATDLSKRQGKVRRPPLTTMKVTQRASVDPTFGSWGLGDNATVSIVDPRHPTGMTSAARIVAYTYRPQSDESPEQVELVFEGDDLNG